MTDQTTETARALLYRYGLPEDVIDGALCLHAQELAAVQREFADQEDAHLATTSASVYVQGIRDGADRIDLMRESAPSAPLPVSEARMRLLQALDASYCQALGHTPEGLLAAYEASGTQTVDQAALRDRIAAALYERERPPRGPHWPDAYPADREVFEAMADAVLAVLPATTNHDTDTSVTARCADCGGGFVPGSDVELTHNCDDHRTVVEAPAATCSAQYHGPGEDAARLCIRAAQHQRTAHTDEHGFHWSDTVAMYPVADGTFRIGTDVRAELRRVADETAATETPCTCFVINDGGVHAVSCAKRADETAATEGQAECTASRSGDCLREAESETACDTDAGECVHGGQPAAGARQDGAQP